MSKDKIIVFLDNCLVFLLYLLIFFIPISKAAIEIIFGISLFIFIINKLLKPEFYFLKNPTHLFLLLFFVFCALSLFNSGIYLNKGIKALFLKWFEYILVFITVEDTLKTHRRINNAISILLITGVFIGIDAIFQHFRGIDFLRQHPLVANIYITASFKNQNSLAGYILPIVLLATILILYQRMDRLYKHILFLLGEIILVTVLVLTHSRSAWFGFIMGLVLLLFLSPNLKKAIIPIFIFIVILNLTPELRNRLIYGKDADRIALIFTSLNMIKDNPFLGKGLGTYMDYFRQYTTIPGIYYAHNDYLQIWAESGVFSLLFFLLFLGSILYKAIKIYLSNKKDNILLLGFICLTGGMLAQMFFEIRLYSLQLAVMFWFMLGLFNAKINQINFSIK